MFLGLYKNTERIGEGCLPKRKTSARYSSAPAGIRTEAKLTQTQPAKVLGVTEARISKYEQGEDELRIDVLELKTLCNAVGLP